MSRYARSILQRLRRTPARGSIGELVTLDDLTFELDWTDFSKKTTANHFLLCKPWSFIETYIKLLAQVPHRRMLELGVHQGGSAVFFAAAFKRLKKLAAVELAAPLPPLDDNLKNNPRLNRKINIHYQTSQDNAAALRSIIREDLEDQPDIVIDDASHQYWPTRVSFETIFPKLTPGGLYIIEDWGWAHWDDYQKPGSPWYDQPALSNLVFELVALQGSHGAWIQNIKILNSAFLVIQKHQKASVLPEPFDLTWSIQARGKVLAHI